VTGGDEWRARLTNGPELGLFLEVKRDGDRASLPRGSWRSIWNRETRHRLSVSDLGSVEPYVSLCLRTDTGTGGWIVAGVVD